MTDRALKSAIQMANAQPPNKAAAEALLKMGRTHNPQELAILELAQAKVQAEEREPPDGLATDILKLKQGLTPDWTRKITAHLDSEGVDASDLQSASAETLLDWIADPIPLEEYSPHWTAQLTRD